MKKSVSLLAFLSALILNASLFAQYSWNTVAPMPTGRQHLCSAVYNDNIYVFGGQGTTSGNQMVNVNEMYDPATNTWMTKTPMPSAIGFCNAGTVNGKIYVIGGWNGGNQTNQNWEYDPVGNTWVVKATMPTTRSDAAVAIVNNKIYAIGGWTMGSVPRAENEMYDPATNTWVSKAPMPTPRGYFTVSVVNNKIYAIGSSNSCKKVEEYDPQTNTWTTKTNMPLAKGGGPGSVVINNEIYVFGGSITPCDTTLIYTPATDLWRTTAILPTHRYFLTASQVNDHAYVIGGGPNDNATFYHANEMFTPFQEKILFSARPTGGNYSFSIYSMNPDGTGKTRLFYDNYHRRCPVISTDHSKIFYQKTKYNYGHEGDSVWICRSNPDGSGEQVLYTHTDPATSALRFNFDVSPDNLDLLFAKVYDGWPSMTGRNGDVFKYTLSTQNSVNLTNDWDFYDTDPQYSPDGSTIIYVKNESSWTAFPTPLYKMNSDGSGNAVFRPSGTGNYQGPEYSPAGDKIIYAYDPGTNPYSALYICNPDGTGLTQVIPSPGTFTGFMDPTFNPDGSKIAVTANSNWKLLLTDLSGTIISLFDTMQINGFFEPTWGMVSTPLSPVAPVSYFTVFQENCAGNSVIFTDSSYLQCGTIVTWIWDFGDGTPPLIINSPSNPDISHQYLTAGIFLVTLTVISYDGRTSSSTEIVSVVSPPVAEFMWAGSCFSEPVQFNDLSMINAPFPSTITSWSWNFGDPVTGAFNYSTLQNPQHIFVLPGIYFVSLVITTSNGCSDTIVKPVSVSQAPVAIADPGSQEVVSMDASLPVNLSTDLPGSYFTWIASTSAPQLTGYISSGTTTTIPSQIINNPLTTMETVTYTITPSFNGCTGQPVTHTITVYPHPSSPVTVTYNIPAVPNTQVAVPVDAKTFTNIKSLSLRLDYDPTYALYSSFSNVNAALSGMQVNDVSISPSLHKIMITWSNATPVSLLPDSRLVDLVFTYSSGTVYLTWNNTDNGGQDCRYLDAAGNPLLDTPTWFCYHNGSIYQGRSITGAFSYNNTTNTPLDSLHVFLLKDNVKEDSVWTNTQGHYGFAGKNSGTYIIQAKTNKSWQGVNGTDAAKILRHFTGLEPLTEPVRLQAADANNNVFINSTDALQVKMRFVNSINSFTRGDWTFAKPATGGDTVIISNSDRIQDFFGLCVGDVNGSNSFGAGGKEASAITVYHSDVVTAAAGSAFDLPVFIRDDLVLTGISFVMDYPEDLFSVTSIQVKQGSPVYRIEKGRIRLAWSEAEPIYIQRGEPVLILKMKASIKFTEGFHVELSPGRETELADENAEVIINPELDIPVIEGFSAFGTSVPALSMTDLRVYPNPAKEQVTISVSSLEKECIVSISILNGLGICVYEKKDVVIHGSLNIPVGLEHFPGGLYSVVMRGNGILVSKKFIIN